MFQITRETSFQTMFKNIKHSAWYVLELQQVLLKLTIIILKIQGYRVSLFFFLIACTLLENENRNSNVSIVCTRTDLIKQISYMISQKKVHTNFKMGSNKNFWITLNLDSNLNGVPQSLLVQPGYQGIFRKGCWLHSSHFPGLSPAHQSMTKTHIENG